MLISAAHYLGNTPRCGIAQPQCSIESREQINCNCDENLPCEGKTWIGIRHELGRIWPILVNKDETANINDGSLTRFFKGKYNWWESADGWELTNLCPLCRGMKKIFALCLAMKNDRVCEGLKKCSVWNERVPCPAQSSNDTANQALPLCGFDNCISLFR